MKDINCATLRKKTDTSQARIGTRVKWGGVLRVTIILVQGVLPLATCRFIINFLIAFSKSMMFWQNNVYA